MTPAEVAVLGGGLMGSGIAEVAAASGYPVALLEVDEPAVASARQRVHESVSRAAARGRVSTDEAALISERIRFTTHVEDIADSALVIEAVPEDMHLKRQVLAVAAEAVDAQTLIASNTSSIPIAELAAVVPNPARVLGLHFFSPVPAMSLVEVVAALETSVNAVERAKEFVASIGKHAIETKDRSGFVVNLLLVPYLMAAVRMYEEGFASREDIDEGMQRGCGHPMGPLALCDLIGIDVIYSVCNELYDEFKRPEYAPPPLLKRMVAAGRHGRKSGHGFYQYEGVAAA